MNIFALKYCCLVDVWFCVCVFEDGWEGFNETLSVSIQQQQQSDQKVVFPK